MTTGQYISWLIQRIAGNLFTRQQLLDAVNQAQNEILGRDIHFMRVLPDPYLRTTAGTYRYTASSSLYDSIDNTTQYDIRNVSRVYALNVRHSPIFEYGGLNRTTHHPETIHQNEVNVPADVQQSKKPLGSDCTIALWRENDPGTQTTVYLAEAYKWPTQLTSESVALSIPEQFQRGLLKYAVLKDLEYTEAGYADKPEELYKKALSEFDSWSSRGAKTTITATQPRDC